MISVTLVLRLGTASGLISHSSASFLLLLSSGISTTVCSKFTTVTRYPVTSAEYSPSSSVGAPTKTQRTSGITVLSFTLRMSCEAGKHTVFPSRTNSQLTFSAGPRGGVHLFSARLNFTGCPGSSPSISNAKCRCDGRAFERNTDSYSLVPVEQQRNSS